MDFGVRETHGILWQPGNEVRAASDGRRWSALYASSQRERPYEAAFAAVPDHLVILHRDGPVRVNRILDGARAEETVASGGLFILPGGMAFGVRLQGPLNSLHVYLRDAVLRAVASELFGGDPDNVAIQPRLGARDPSVRHVLLAIGEALADPAPVSALYTDYLARSLAARLLLTHAAPPLASAGRLSAPQLSRALACMDANLSDTLTLADIARAANLSPSQLVRRFRASVGTTPHQHLIRLRLERAARLLRETAEPVAQIALDCGFAHQEHLTRCFSRARGTTPAAFRRAR